MGQVGLPALTSVRFVLGSWSFTNSFSKAELSPEPQFPLLGSTDGQPPNPGTPSPDLGSSESLVGVLCSVLQAQLLALRISAILTCPILL